jgi:hypothetical protein
MNQAATAVGASTRHVSSRRRLSTAFSQELLRTSRTIFIFSPSKDYLGKHFFGDHRKAMDGRRGAVGKLVLKNTVAIIDAIFCRFFSEELLQSLHGAGNRIARRLLLGHSQGDQRQFQRQGSGKSQAAQVEQHPVSGRLPLPVRQGCFSLFLFGNP